MKMKYSALVLATSLLAAPTWVLAESKTDDAASKQTISEPAAEQTKNGKAKQGAGSADARYYGHKSHDFKGQSHKGHGNKYYRGYQDKQMSPEHFAKYLDKRLAKLDSPELKAQFIKASQARLTAQAEQSQLRRLMAEHKAKDIGDKAIKEATLEKIAADHKLKQLRNKQLQDLLSKAKK